MPIGSLLFLFVRDCASVCFYSLCTNFCSSLFTLSLGCAISSILFDFQVTLNCSEIPFDIRLSIRRINIRLLFISFLSICFFEENQSSVCDCFFVCSGKKIRKLPSYFGNLPLHTEYNFLQYNIFVKKCCILMGNIGP